MKIVQLIDTLNSGGAERVSVNYANMLSDEIEQSFLVTTRNSGVLETELNENVQYLNLEKTTTFDFRAFKKLKSFLREHDIQVIHAHTTSYFFAVLTKLLYTKIKIVWHDHQGNRDEISVFKQIPLVLASFFFSGVITVNKRLELWAKKHLYCRNVISIENFVSLRIREDAETQLYGKDGFRMICLANLRYPKNHLFLLEAFEATLKEHEDWSLHLVGNDYGDSYSKEVHLYILNNELQNSVFVYGLKNDVANILNQCEIGVIASTFEGLPMALLEYGNSGLGVITTDVGSCSSLVEGRGLVIKSGDKQQLTEAMKKLMDDSDFRSESSTKLEEHINNNFSEQVIIKKALLFYGSF